MAEQFLESSEVNFRAGVPFGCSFEGENWKFSVICCRIFGARCKGMAGGLQAKFAEAFDLTAVVTSPATFLETFA